MKKSIIFFILLFSLSSFSQTWSKYMNKGDELAGTPDTYYYVCRNGVNTFVCWSEYDYIKIICKEYEMFNYETYISEYSYDEYFYAKVGYYDAQGNLLEKEEIRFSPQEGNPGTAFSSNRSKTSVKKLREFLRDNKTGYVRILANLYGGGRFDMKLTPYSSIVVK